MIYLLDANVLIDANRDYYATDRVPEFWDWLVHHGQADSVKMPIEIYEEIKDGNDQLALWTKDDGVETALLLVEPGSFLIGRMFITPSPRRCVFLPAFVRRCTMHAARAPLPTAGQ